MTDKPEIQLWGYSGDLQGNESCLMICPPIIKNPRDGRLGVASKQPWSLDIPSSIRWFHDEEEALLSATQVRSKTGVKIPPSAVVMVAGPAFLTDMSNIAQAKECSQINKLISQLIKIQKDFFIVVTSAEESVKWRKAIADNAKSLFDKELLSVQFSKLTDKAGAALRVLQGTPNARQDEIAIRRLIKFKIEENVDAYRRSLELSAIKLKTDELQLESQVERYREFLTSTQHIKQQPKTMFRADWAAILNKSFRRQSRPIFADQHSSNRSKSLTHESKQSACR